MYYRIAIHKGQPPSWQWSSTILSSIDSVVRLLRRYQALAPDRLRVFSSRSVEDMNEQLARENNGLGSSSVIGAQFLQERLIGSPSLISAHEARTQREAAPSGIVSVLPVNENRTEIDTQETARMSALDASRFVLEQGPGGDHDLPYTFTLPASWPETRTWINLQARVRNGDLPS